jgi:hypothetical protein
MKTLRWIFSPIALALLVVVWSGPSAQAQTVATNVTVVSALNVTVAGSFTEPDGTTLKVSGWVVVNSSMVTDAAGAKRVILTLDFSNVTLQSGAGKNLTTYGTGGFQASTIRPLVASDVLPITCPRFTSAGGILSARSWLVTTTLNFDLTTGKLASGSATVGTNPYATTA